MNQQLEQAKQLFQQGDFDAVITVCRQNTGSHPLFELLLASALGKRGEYQEAHKWFNDLKQRFASNPDITFNQALTYKEAGQLSVAIDLLNSTLQIQKDYHPAWFALGNTYIASGQFDKAISAFEQAVMRQPQHSPYRLGLGQALLQTGQPDKAISLFYPFDVANDELPITELGLVAYYQCQEREMATRLYEQAFALNQQSFTLFYYAALNDIDEKRYYRARAYLQRASEYEVPKEEELSLALNQAFCTFMLEGDISVLRQFDSRVTQAPATTQLFLAQLYESLARYADCGRILEQAQPVTEDEQVKYHQLRAKCALVDGDTETARALLAADPATQNDSSIYLRVAIAERQQDYALAGSLLADIASRQPQPNPFVAQFSQDVAAALTHTVVPHPDNQGQPDSMPAMVFVVGFPRSGTTLMEQKLAAYQGAIVLEETSLIQRLHRQLTEQAGSQALSDWLSAQSEEAKTAIRQDFLHQVEHYCGPIKAGDWLLDKMPFNCLYLPLITTLFPHARIIWAHRHPKDIFISCLKQEEIRLFTAQDFEAAYADYLRLWEKFRTLPASQLLRVHYEALVTDADAWLQRIASWAGLRDDEAPTRERMVITPSYQQVSQAVYTSSVNKFSYYTGLLPGLDNPALSRFADVLGYTE